MLPFTIFINSMLTSNILNMRERYFLVLNTPSLLSPPSSSLLKAVQSNRFKMAEIEVMNKANDNVGAVVVSVFYE